MMELKITDVDGWMCVALESTVPWQKSTFFPLVDNWYDQMREAYEKNPRPLLFDFSVLTYVDSILTSLVLRGIRLAQEHRNALVVPSAEVRGIMILLGIDRLVELFHSRDEWNMSNAIG